MNNNQTSLDERVTHVAVPYRNGITVRAIPIVATASQTPLTGDEELMLELYEDLKEEQAKNEKLRKALEDIAEWECVSDSQDAISAARTAIEALATKEG